MEKKTMTVLSPDFYNDFHCTAAGCRHNCCVHPWTIAINKKNYKELRQLKSPRWLAEDFGNYIKRNPNSKSVSDYALAVYDEHGCRFQTKEGLCRLQLDVGAEYLSQTCQKYPRLFSYTIDTVAAEIHREFSLAVSCEEVVRMLLHRREPILFVSGEEQYSITNFNNENRTANNMVVNEGNRPILTYYHLIRAVCIALLQNRDYYIEQRLMLLILYLDKLEQAEQSEAEGDVPAMTDTFIKAVDERMYDKLFAATPTPEVSAMLTNFAALYAFEGDAGNYIVAQCMHSIKHLDYSARADSYNRLVRTQEHFVEHLFVMEFFGKALPFKNGRSIRDCIQYLASVFTIFRFMLGAYIGESTNLNESELIDFVAYFGKVVLHSSDSFDRNIGLLKNNGMDTLPYLMSIILG